MSYIYSPELKAPQKMPEIDPGKPAMKGMLKILCITHQKQAEAFQPPQGLSIRRISVSTTGDMQICCFVIEPEDTDVDLPGILMIHGGAFYLPIQTNTLSIACEYAKGIHARIFVPEYRLVPQYSAPAQLDDCTAVWKELSEHSERYGVDPSRLLVAGDSAGAALAAGLCIRMRDEGRLLPKGQLLIYPVMDDRADRYTSYEQYKDACWSSSATHSMWAAYLKGTDEKLLPWLAPARCENLQGLPPTYVEPQEIDVLRYEGVKYAEALHAAGVPVELHIVKGSYHGFDSDLTSPLVQKMLALRINAASTFLK